MTGRMEEDVHSIQLGKKGKTISVKYHFLPTVSAKVTANFKQIQSRVEDRVPLFLGPRPEVPLREYFAYD